MAIPDRPQRGQILAPNQLYFMAADQASPNAFDYNLALQYRLDGMISPIELDRRLGRIPGLPAQPFVRVERNEAGITLHLMQAGQVEVVASALEPDSSEVTAMLRSRCQRPFDMSSGPLFRASLVQYRGDRSDLLLVAHHLVSDKTTLEVLAQTLISDVPAAHHEYNFDGRAAIWWARLQASATAQAALNRSSEEHSATVPLDWGCALPQTIKSESRKVSLTLPAPLWQVAMGALCSAGNIDTECVVIGALGLVISRNAHVGSPDLLRMASQRPDDLAGALGCFMVPTLIRMPSHSADWTVATFLQQVSTACASASTNADTVLGSLLRNIQSLADLRICITHDPLQSAIEYVDSLGQRREAMPQPVPHFGANRFAIDVLWRVTAAGDLELDISFCPSTFDESVATTLAGQILHTIGALGEDPQRPLSEVSTLPPGEVKRILTLSRGADLSAPQDTIISCLASIVERFPHKTAVQGPERSYTYSELWRASERIAAMLQSCGVDEGDVVTLLVDRGAALIPALMGILRAGATYHPVDLHTPAQRRAAMMLDVQAKALLTDQDVSDPAGPYVQVNLDQALSCEEPYHPLASIAADSTAYVIYTSGSTGQPKGVPITHRNVMSLLDAASRVINLSSSDVWSFFHSIAFDFSVWEIFGCLCTGGQLIVIPHFVARSPSEFHATLMHQHVTILSQTPSAFSQLLATDLGSIATLQVRCVIFGGEQLDLKVLDRWLRKYPVGQCELINMYGITETTVHCTHRRIVPQDVVADTRSVGRPLPGWNIYVLDEHKRIAPIGVEGELYVGGAGVAGRYLNRPELTRERFVRIGLTQGADDLLYRSGDRGRYLPSGELEYLGRLDSQIKLRGYRIELGEIRSALLQSPQITAAAVILDNAGGDPAGACLRAYVVAKGDLDTASIKNRLRTILPGYMVPSTIAAVTQLPLTPNGKIDQRALLALDSRRHAPAAVDISNPSTRLAQLQEEGMQAGA